MDLGFAGRRSGGSGPIAVDVCAAGALPRCGRTRAGEGARSARCGKSEESLFPPPRRAPASRWPCPWPWALALVPLSVAAGHGGRGARRLSKARLAFRVRWPLGWRLAQVTDFVGVTRRRIRAAEPDSDLPVEIEIDMLSTRSHCQARQVRLRKASRRAADASDEAMHLLV